MPVQGICLAFLAQPTAALSATGMVVGILLPGACRSFPSCICPP